MMGFISSLAGLAGLCERQAQDAQDAYAAGDIARAKDAERKLRQAQRSLKTLADEKARDAAAAASRRGIGR